MKYKKDINNIIQIGRLLWDKDLVSAWNGNISLRLNKDLLLMTGRGTCLGRLRAKDIVLVGVDGRVFGRGEPTSERLLHFDIYRNLPSVSAVVHTHTPCINAFFLNNKCFTPKTFEAQYVLGKVVGVDQSSVNVTKTKPVVGALKTSALVALRRHGIVATGTTLFDCVAKIQVLEEQLWMEALSKVFALT